MYAKYWLVLVSISLAVGSACKTPEREYCKENYGNPAFEERDACCERYPEDCSLGGNCESSDDCGFETPHCKVEMRTCVACLEDAHCASDPTRPSCDLENNTCVGCRENADCESQLCLADGACAASEEVAYVSDTNAADNGMCTWDAPCQNLGQALAIMPPRKFIKVAGAILHTGVTKIDSRTVAIYGEAGISSISSSSGIVLEIGKQSDVAIFDLDITGSPSGDAVKLSDSPGPKLSLTRIKVRAPTGNGITVSDGNLTMSNSDVYNSGIGIDMAKGKLAITGSRVFDNQAEGVKCAAGTVEITGSSIRGNRGNAGLSTAGAGMVTVDSSVITGNTGVKGGISIDGRFRIRNSLIVRNGSGTSTTGGLNLSSSAGVLEFSTVANNVADVGRTGGVDCAGTIEISNSIVINNGNVINLNCNVTHSLTATMAPSLPGEGNKFGDPVFLNMTNAADPGYFRIGATSAARDSANVTSTVDVDIDGQLRDDVRRDMGADEFK